MNIKYICKAVFVRTVRNMDRTKAVTASLCIATQKYTRKKKDDKLYLPAALCTLAARSEPHASLALW